MTRMDSQRHGVSTDVATASANEPVRNGVESYRVEPDADNPNAHWHVLTFYDGRQRHIYTDRPLVEVEPETH